MPGTSNLGRWGLRGIVLFYLSALLIIPIGTIKSAER